MMMSGGRGLKLLLDPSTNHYRVLVGPWNWLKFGVYDGLIEEHTSHWWHGVSRYLREMAYED